MNVRKNLRARELGMLIGSSRQTRGLGNFSRFNYYAFSLAEMMVVMLIMSIVLAAMAPMITTRIKADQALKAAGIASSGGSSDNEGPWKWVENSDTDAYSEASRNMIGQTEAETKDGDAMLIINTGDDNKDGILFKGMANSYKDKFAGHIKMLRTKSGSSYYDNLIMGTIVSYSEGWDGAVAVGFDNRPNDLNCVLFGRGNSTYWPYSTAIGFNNSVSAKRTPGYSTAVGYGNSSNSSYTLLVGYQNETKSDYQGPVNFSQNQGPYGDYIYYPTENTLVGYKNAVIANGASVFGYSNTVRANNASAFGYKNNVIVSRSHTSDVPSFACGTSNTVYTGFAVGSNNSIDGGYFTVGKSNSCTNGSAVGVSNTATGGMAFGTSNKTSAGYVFGYGNNSSSSDVFGFANSVTSTGCGETTVIGCRNEITVDSNYSFVAGHKNSISSPSSYYGSNTVVGVSNKVSNGKGMATVVGLGNEVSAQEAVAMGRKTIASGDYSLAVGTETTSWGSYTKASGKYSVAVGGSCTSSGEYALSFGTISTASGIGSIAIGHRAVAKGDYSVAIGSTQDSGTVEPPKANADWSVAIGYGAVADNPYDVVIGTPYYSTVRVPILQASILRVGNGSSGNEVLLVNGGVVTVDGTLKVNGTTVQSDKRLKYIKGENKNGLDAIKKIKVYNFTFKKDKDKEPRVGVIAQELQKILPDAVKKGSDGFLTIRIDDIIYTLVNAVKELDRKVSELTETLKQVQAEQKRINQRLDALERK